MAISLANLERFAALAELGVTAEACAHSMGIGLEELNEACLDQWGTPAAQVVAIAMVGAPVRALNVAISHSLTDPKTALEVVHLAKEARQSAPLRSLETRDEFVAKQRAALGLKAV